MDVLGIIGSIKENRNTIIAYEKKIEAHKKKMNIKSDDFIEDCQREITKLENIIKLDEWEISTMHDIPSNMSSFSAEEINEELKEMKLDLPSVEVWGDNREHWGTENYG